MSLDDIWDADLVEAPIVHVEPINTDTSRLKRGQLFYSDSEEDVQANNAHSPDAGSPFSRNNDNEAGVPNAPSKEHIEAIFADLDDEEDIFRDIGVVNVEKLKRQAAAKLTTTKGADKKTVTSTFDPLGASSSPSKKGKGGAKVKRVMPKLDEERLLGKDGFPRLLKEYKNFKVTGKGHEAADLDRLFRLYYGWAHKLYPKFKLSDTVERVEKLCRSRRMTANLRVWRDEANGVVPEGQHEVTKGSDDSDGEREGAAETGGTNNRESHIRSDSAGASSSRPSTPLTRPSTAPSVPSSATDVEDLDIDALLREEEELLREINEEQGRSAYQPVVVEENDNEALWAAAGKLSDDIPDISMKKALGPRNPGGKHEDMWHIMAEMEATSNSTEPAEDVRQKDASSEPTIGADWDDMYE